MLPKNHIDELRIFQSTIDTCLSFTGGLSLRKLSTLLWKNLHLQESHLSELIKSFYLQLDFNTILYSWRSVVIILIGLGDEYLRLKDETQPTYLLAPFIHPEVDALEH
ncbi:unnamed protein product [Hymenolepis diminuta]|uniref:Uncharacterized protein n=1 Tax=Hymenolepis diminuta TaxID=6216 RepID=A0A0R3SIR9_HYMDI|nr:unnamed protein product [Hymenolepis diminuta]VUZ49539.1 unnamed protein product [Hymenolepis diminuta]